MTIEVECIWKNGKIVPLENINLKENTTVLVSITPKNGDRKAFLKLAGTWKNDDETYNVFKGVYGKRHVFTLRR